MATSNWLYNHRSCHIRSRLLVFFVFSLLLGPGKAAAASTTEPPEISPNQEEWVQDVNTPLNLTCRAASPVAWCTHDTFSTDYEELYEPGHEKPFVSILTIRNVSIYHVGYFSCVYNTTENKEKSNCDPSDPTISSLYLYVKDPENLLVFPPARLIQGEIGRSVVVPCKPTFPDVKVALYKDHDLSNAEYNPRTGFQIEHVTMKDNVGQYLCTTTYGNEIQDFFLFLDAIVVKRVDLQVPLVEVQGEWQEDTRSDSDLLVYYVEQGTDVNLTCNATGKELPTAYKLEWSNNTQQNKTGRHRIIRDPKKQRFYEITDAQPEDSGIYSCWPKLQNERQTPGRLNLTVIPKDAAYISATIYTTNVTTPDDPVQWEIIYIAYPEPTFKWMKDGEVLRDWENPHSPNQKPNCEMNWTRHDGALMLVLHHPTVTDNGKYTVEASLPGTNITTVTDMFLLIPGKPENVQIKSGKHMHKEKTSFSLMCSAYGYPKPNITIHFTPFHSNATEGARVYNQVEQKGMDADKTDGMVKRTMHWMGVAEQPGWYHCVAENKFAIERSQNWSFLLTEFDSEQTISLELKIDGKVNATENTKSVMVVEGDNMVLTCRANKQTTKPPLTWKLDGTDLKEVKDAWDMEVHEDETRFSLLSTVSTRRLKMTADNFTLTCSDSGVNHTSLSFVVKAMQKPTWRIGAPKKKTYEKNMNEALDLTCLVDGTPKPLVVWKKDNEVLKQNHRHYVLHNNNQNLSIRVLLPPLQGKYTCEVSNRAGSLSADFDVVVRNPEDQKTMIILSVVAVLIVALVILSVFFCRKIYQARKETLNLQLRDQKLFLEGDPNSLNPDISLEQQAELLPYNTKYEVSRDAIIFDKLLGTGAFGRVYRATALNLLPGEARTTVAVKMMKSRTDCAQLKALRSEVKIMLHIGRHINIVNLLGACSKNLASKGELLLLVEYCKYGNILDYMRRHRREFINQINDEDRIDPAFTIEPRPRHRSDSSSRSRCSRGLKYAHLNFHQDNVFYGHDQAAEGASSTPTTLLSPPRLNGEASGGSDGRPYRARTVSASSGTHHIASDNSLMLPSETSAGTSDGYLSAQSMMGTQSLLSSQAPLCSMDILGWAYQIAKGMEYLAFKKVLHGDLAARNVLLAENNVVKISDFGLAKDIYKDKKYKMKGDGPMPVKWLAVECLRDGVFSTQSDVWSFGVVMWEIFSLGQIPYSCTEFDESFISKLEKGVRLEQPQYATYGLYREMLNCWNNDPLERPSFTALEATLGDMLGEAQRQNYIQLTEPYQQENFTSEFLDMLPSQDYATKVRETTPQLTEDGYEMPFSPGMAPQVVMVHGDGQSMDMRFTNRQMEYIQNAASEDSHGSYLPMSADRKDRSSVFDFGNEAVAGLMGSRNEQDSNKVEDLYLKMDGTTPQPTPPPDTPDAAPLKVSRESPRHLVLRSLSSQGSQSGGRHQPMTRHDSGVYSPTATIQTNPSYMQMSPLQSPKDNDGFVKNNNINNNNNNTKVTLEDERTAYVNLSSPAHVKACDYAADGKDKTEYMNLLPQDSGRRRTLSESSSGVGSIEEESPPRQRGGSVLRSPPILEEAVAVAV